MQLHKAQHLAADWALFLQENACEVNYWSFPAPTLWGETKHIGGAGYTSKMAEFEAFVDRAKLKSLPFTHVSSDPSGPPCSQIASTLPRGDAKESAQSSQSSQKAGSSTAAVKQQSVLVVSDFPHLHNADARARFKESLAALVATSEAPTIILVTDSGAFLFPCFLCIYVHAVWVHSMHYVSYKPES